MQSDKGAVLEALMVGYAMPLIAILCLTASVRSFIFTSFLFLRSSFLALMLSHSLLSSFYGFVKYYFEIGVGGL